MGGETMVTPKPNREILGGQKLDSSGSGSIQGQGVQNRSPFLNISSGCVVNGGRNDGYTEAQSGNTRRVKFKKYSDLAEILICHRGGKMEQNDVRFRRIGLVIKEI
jgi:hypothetical protein